MRLSCLISLVLSLGCGPGEVETRSPVQQSRDAGQPSPEVPGLSPDGDADEDGVPNADDLCQGTAYGAAVWPDGDWVGCAEGQRRSRTPPAGSPPADSEPDTPEPVEPPPDAPSDDEPAPEVPPVEDDPPDDAPPDDPPPDPPGPGPEPEPAPEGFGEACEDDADCDTGTCLGHLPGGYCSRACNDEAPCPDGGACWALRALDGAEYCLQSCALQTECRGEAGYVCDGDLTCYPGEAPPEFPNADPEAPFGGPPPDCDDLPDFRCDGSDGPCGELVPFLPELGDGYWNYPLNGETDDNQYRSYARRDLAMLVKYAAARTRCLSASWDSGNHEPLGLGDMSEADGAIPGTSDGDPGHPAGSHTDGLDMDIAYFQVGHPDNLLRPICDHEAGGEQNHCTSDPDRLDVWRTALFLALLHDSPQLRVIGVDGRVGPLVEQAIRTLCGRGFLADGACDESSLAYETRDTGRGWFRFHHHHFHVSILPSRSVRAAGPVMGPEACMTPTCE